MRAGDVIARDNGKVHVLAWKDKRVVKAISTKHDAFSTTITRRIKRGGGTTEEVSKPACIVDYNKYMAGVDGLDQMISYYPLHEKIGELDHEGLVLPYGDQCAQCIRAVQGTEQYEAVQHHVQIRAATC